MGKKQGGAIDSFNRVATSLFWGGIGAVLFLAGGWILGMVVEELIVGGWW
jgi:hypothetical protein